MTVCIAPALNKEEPIMDKGQGVLIINYVDDKIAEEQEHD